MELQAFEKYFKLPLYIVPDSIPQEILLDWLL